MSTPLDLSNPGRTIHVGVILMQGVTEILDTAPIDLIAGMSKEIDELPDELIPQGVKKQALDIKFHWVNQTGEVAKMTAGLLVQPTDNFETCPPLDIALMGAHNMRYTPNEAELSFIRKTYEHCSAFLTVCGGFQAPLMAGVYQGKTATAPREMLEQLRSTTTGIEWVEERWHRDGKLWTSGILLNGLSLMRAFAEIIWGGEGTLAERMLLLGDWPKRDVNYADALHTPESIKTPVKVT